MTKDDPLKELLTTEEYSKGYQDGFDAGQGATKPPEDFGRLVRVILRYERDLKAIRRAMRADATRLRQQADESLAAGQRIKDTGTAHGRYRSPIGR